MTGHDNPRDPGLQAERTTLAWTRTTFAVLAVSGVTALKDCQSHTGPLGFLAAGLAVTVALITWLTSARRQRILSHGKHIRPTELHREAYIVGVSTIALSGASTLVLMV